MLEGVFSVGVGVAVRGREEEGGIGIALLVYAIYVYCAYMRHEGYVCGNMHCVSA